MTEHKTNTKSKRSKIGFVYIIGFCEPELVKIGVSTEPIKRIQIVSCQLGILNFKTHISRMLVNPYAVETKCCRALRNFTKENHVFKRELFAYSFDKAVDLVNSLSDGTTRRTIEIEI